MLLLWRFKPYRRVPLLARLARLFMRLFVQLSLRSKAKQLLGFYQIATRIGDVYKVGFLMFMCNVPCQLCRLCTMCLYCAFYGFMPTIPAIPTMPTEPCMPTMPSMTTVA
jgi:hypothetical protein